MSPEQLKYDDRTSVGGVSWTMVILPPLLTAFLCAVIWLALHYRSAGQSIVTNFTPEVARTVLVQANVSDLEVYHERYLFRDLMLLLTLGLLFGYASLVTPVSCSNCDIPYATAAAMVMVISMMRIICLLLRAYFDYHRLRELAREVRHFKSWRDERRFRDSAVPSLSNRFKFSPYSVIEALLMLGSLCFLALGTLWMETDACLLTCSKGYHLCKHLTVTMYGVEGLYALSVVGLYYMRRVCGVEQLELTIAWMNDDNLKRDEIRKEELRNPRPKDVYLN